MILSGLKCWLRKVLCGQVAETGSSACVTLQDARGHPGDSSDSCLFPQYFEHVEEAVWAVHVLRESGKPVAVSLCIGPAGDLHGVTPGECAVRLVEAGNS